MKTEYHESTLYRSDPPFGGDLIKAEGALCPDGVRRTAHPTGDGLADTFFSIPAYVYAQRRRVYGYITVECVSGSSVPTPDDPATVKFIPYKYRRHHALVEPKVVPVVVVPPPLNPSLLHVAKARQSLARSAYRQKVLYDGDSSESRSFHQRTTERHYRRARLAYAAAMGQICP